MSENKTFSLFHSKPTKKGIVFNPVTSRTTKDKFTKSMNMDISKLSKEEQLKYINKLFQVKNK
jgi:hypothetical protein